MKRYTLFCLLAVVCVIGAVNAGGCGGKVDDLACRCGGPCPSPTPSVSEYAEPEHFPAASPSSTPEDDAEAFAPTQDADESDGGCE